MPKTPKKEHDLIEATREMLAHHRGEISLPTRKVTAPATIDVGSIRKRFAISQKRFADHFGFALSAIKEWEQGRRTPKRATRIFLAIIDTNPEAIEKALEHLSS